MTAMGSSRDAPAAGPGAAGGAVTVELLPGWSSFEVQARFALQALNRRVASIYRQEVVPDVRIEFTDLIEEHVRKDFTTGQNIVTRRTLGHCIRSQKIIRLVPCKGWQNTAVHEFIHFYNPGRSEAWVRKATRDVVRLLKQGGLWTQEGHQ